eukprot:TRINITY_DN885_c0_g1_i1.p1 TRINITY_DN885_c0_g1~~TRINITY_DN885_c0_g1_i1.p1  ORF type:complete len:683 (-),score=96.84 TRINITY_DN885_c0_g1_i1:346-2313(-)
MKISSSSSVCFLFVFMMTIMLSDHVIGGHIANSKIKKIVVLMEENRSYDHMLGWNPAGNGLKGSEYNLVNTSNPSSKRVYVDKLQPMIAPCGPDHGTLATTYKIFGADALSRNDTSVAGMSGFAEWEGLIGKASTNYCDVMSMLTPAHIPVMTALVQEYASMDRFFASHPGPTWPNRMFMLSGTSAGSTETFAFYRDQPGVLFPQETIFDQLAKEGFTWRNYYNDTPWELFMQSIAHNPENLVSLEQFFVDARDGLLPDFSWINPRSGINVTTMQGSNDQHPDHDISLGELHYKAIYEALRSSPHWNETLLIVTYDEHGGYFDHVPTPLNVPPPGDGETSYPDGDFLFDRLGIRMPTLLISPWIPKGLIVSAPPDAQKPYPNSEYSLTSIIATVRKLFGMTSPPLTKRDAWSATFEHLFNLTSPRDDCPFHLPDAAPLLPQFSPDLEAKQPLNGLQQHIMTVHAHLAGVPFPSHITRQGEMSEWAHHHFQKHKTATIAWKKSKMDSPYTLLIRNSGDGPFLKHTWDVNRSQNVPFFTISLRNSSLCLSYSTLSSGSLLGVSDCYPSATPSLNRDTQQQWLWDDDATVRPYADRTYCMTNAIDKMPVGDQRVFLTLCDGSVEQHWAWYGPAAGNGDSGYIYYGDGAVNQLGIIATE